MAEHHRNRARRRASAKAWRRSWTPEYRSRRVAQIRAWRERHALETYLYYRFMFLMNRDAINARRNKRRAGRKLTVAVLHARWQTT